MTRHEKHPEKTKNYKIFFFFLFEDGVTWTGGDFGCGDGRLRSCWPAF